MRMRVEQQTAAAGQHVEIPDDAQHVEVEHYGGGALVRVSYLRPVPEIRFEDPNGGNDDPFM